MADERIEVHAAMPERHYVRVYHDFLRSTNLTAEEKLIYISLKSFVDFAHDEGEVFPSVNTLCQLTSMSRPRVTRTITSLIKKGVVKKERRGLTKSNLYTLYDNPSMWAAGSMEEMQKAAERIIPYSNEDMIAELKRRGMSKRQIFELIDNEKEPSDVGATDSSTNEINEISNNDFNSSREKLQGGNKRYSLSDIREMMDYEHMIAEEPANNSLIDTAIEVIRDVLNTSRQTLRVGQEEVPVSEVKARLLSLNHIMIMQCIDSIVEQSERGEPPRNIQSYVLTTLYRAKSQDAKTDLQARHDMMHWSEVGQKKQIKNKPDDDWYDNC